MNLEQQRQQAQQAFVASGQNIEIGSLQGIPLALAELKQRSLTCFKHIVDTQSSVYMSWRLIMSNRAKCPVSRM